MVRLVSNVVVSNHIGLLNFQNHEQSRSKMWVISHHASSSTMVASDMVASLRLAFARCNSWKGGRATTKSSGILSSTGPEHQSMSQGEEARTSAEGGIRILCISGQNGNKRTDSRRYSSAFVISCCSVLPIQSTPYTPRPLISAKCAALSGDTDAMAPTESHRTPVNQTRSDIYIHVMSFLEAFRRRKVAETPYSSLLTINGMRMPTVILLSTQ